MSTPLIAVIVAITKGTSIPTQTGAATWQRSPPGRPGSSTGASPPASAKAPTRHPPPTTRSSHGPSTTAAAGLEG